MFHIALFGCLSYCFRDKRQFQSKIANFSHAPDAVYDTTLKGFPVPSPWNWVPEHGVKKNYNGGATGQRKKFDDIFSSVDIIHQRDRQTGGQTDTPERQQRLRLRIASRGKK